MGVFVIAFLLSSLYMEIFIFKKHDTLAVANYHGGFFFYS